MYIFIYLSIYLYYLFQAPFVDAKFVLSPDLSVLYDYVILYYIVILLFNAILYYIIP